MKTQEKITFDPAWKEKYANEFSSAREAVQSIHPGNRVFVGTGCAEPQELIRALASRSRELADVEIVHLLTLGEAPYALRELSGHFRVNSFFIAENVRNIIQEGLGDYTPIFLSDIPRLFRTGQMPLDVTLIHVSPPDHDGVCSLGISVDIVKSAADNASVVIAEVNPRMPRTHGDSFINIHDIDILVPVDYPLVEVFPPEPSEMIDRIGEHIAGLVENGSTMELGIGVIPHSTMKFLKNKKDLGIHTEMLTDEVILLVESGTITGSRKSLDVGKIVASFCVGTKRLYDYINDNPLFEFHPTEYVNDVMIIGRQTKMVAINVALEVDLTGQVCADSLGSRFFSGIGGQADFCRGAARSENGKSIIALPSTAREGEISRIVLTLSPGAGVVTTRGDIHYVVTEYGVAYLHGKSIEDRALALISIAHPDFREGLFNEAVKLKYIRPELADVGNRISLIPPQLKTSHILDDGTQINFRPIHPTDEHAMKDLFYRLSPESLYYRFMSRFKIVPRKQIKNFVFIDPRTTNTVVGTLPESHGEEIIAVGSYHLDPKTNRAEAALVVHDDWHNRGIGTFLLKHLANKAKRDGIRGFVLDVLPDNKAMQKVIYYCEGHIRTGYETGSFIYQIDFQ